MQPGVVITKYLYIVQEEVKYVEDFKKHAIARTKNLCHLERMSMYPLLSFSTDFLSRKVSLSISFISSVVESMLMRKVVLGEFKSSN